MDQHRKTPRAKFLDYDRGEYFVTICAKDKKHYFGEILNGEIFLSEIGEYVKGLLKSANLLCDYVDVTLFVVMPNHIHLLVNICKDHSSVETEIGIVQRSPNPSLRANPTCQRHVPTLSKYVNSLKGAVTKYAGVLGIEFEWQSRYHDHLIRGIKDRNNISKYIVNNVAKWQEDCFNR